MSCGGDLMRLVWNAGVTRTVILTRRWAFKFPSLAYGWKFFLYGFLANMQERQWSGFDERLCPVRFALPLGLLVVMPRCRELTDDEFCDHVHDDWPRLTDTLGRPLPYSAELPVEMKSNSFGYLNGRVVAFDYGGCGRDGRTTVTAPDTGEL